MSAVLTAVGRAMWHALRGTCKALWAGCELWGWLQYPVGDVPPQIASQAEEYRRNALRHAQRHYMRVEVRYMRASHRAYLRVWKLEHGNDVQDA